MRYLDFVHFFGSPSERSFLQLNEFLGRGKTTPSCEIYYAVVCFSREGKPKKCTKSRVWHRYRRSLVKRTSLKSHGLAKGSQLPNDCVAFVCKQLDRLGPVRSGPDRDGLITLMSRRMTIDEGNLKFETSSLWERPVPELGYLLQNFLMTPLFADR